MIRKLLGSKLTFSKISARRKKFHKKCSENSRSQIVFRTDIFRILTLHGCPWVLGTLYTDKRQTWEGDVRNPRRTKAFLKMAGLFWLPYHKKILCNLKQRNSWTGGKQFSPAIVWQLSTATSAAPLQFFMPKEIGSVSLPNSWYLIYYWFTIRFPAWSLLICTQV